MAPVVSIVVAMALCNLAWAFFYFGLHRRGIGYTDGYSITAGYFLLVALISITIFKNIILPRVLPVDGGALMIFAGFMALQGLWYTFFPKFVYEPTEYFAHYPDRYYLKIDTRRLLSKSMDILAQQVIIVVLLVSLQSLGLTMLGIIGWFFILFALLHVPLIVSERGLWPSWLFAGAVVVFSLVFPPLILFVPYGFVYTFIIHWLFYTVSASVFWILQNRRSIW